MSTPAFRQSPDDAEWWSDPAYVVSENRPPISLSTTTDGDAPDESHVRRMVERLSPIEPLVLAASERILQNYSYEHFRNLGVDESRLVKDENPGAIAAAVELVSVWFFNPASESFEMSFHAPWDDHHSFDVEFDRGEAICCAVNG